MLGWFKKKEVEVPKPQKMDFGNYNMRLTIKAICMYEKMSGNSFFRFDMANDIVVLLYCIFYTSNNVEIKYSTFVKMLENEQVSKWVALKYKDIIEGVQQFSKSDKEDVEDVENGKLTMTDVATSLIIDYHVDAHYVMYEMNVWEVEPFFTACDASVKRRYEEQRLWTYLDVMPHIDTKKVKGPDQLLPFPWEKEMKKKKVEQDLKNNEYAIKHTIGMNIDDILHGSR